jgi:diadenosine tetraphosphate (Ap4A) HIT family hydrolase
MPDAVTTTALAYWASVDRIAESADFFAVHDRYPVNNGHTLIVAKRDVLTMMDLSVTEWASLQTMIGKVTRHLSQIYAPDGYNVGANCGAAAGQTVMRFHLHVIPRYRGDVENPQGGVRNFKPAMVPYVVE